MSYPALYPKLIPENTISGFCGIRFKSATFTQSAGVPLRLYAITPSTSKSTFLTTISERMVIRCDIALHWLSGATTHTSPSLHAILARCFIPSACIPSSFTTSILIYLSFHIYYLLHSFIFFSCISQTLKMRLSYLPYHQVLSKCSNYIPADLVLDFHYLDRLLLLFAFLLVFLFVFLF